jgi:hypothetical protein
VGLMCCVLVVWLVGVSVLLGDGFLVFVFMVLCVRFL